jgi:hypothetical protein
MAITYDPSKVLSKIAPRKKLKKLLTRGAKLKRTALSFVKDIDFLDKKKITEVAIKTVKSYEQRLEATDKPKDIKKEIKKNPKLLMHRVENEVLLQITEGIKEKYRGEYYIWLPSDANEPDPEHQLKYGKKFQVGVGEMPGERYGCRCGMQILTSDTELNI